MMSSQLRDCWVIDTGGLKRVSISFSHTCERGVKHAHTSWGLAAAWEKADKKLDIMYMLSLHLSCHMLAGKNGHIFVECVTSRTHNRASGRRVRFFCGVEEQDNRHVPARCHLKMNVGTLEAD